MNTDAVSVAANRAVVVRRVKDALGLTDIPAADWSVDQRIAYNKALAVEIAKYPNGFGAQDLKTAGLVTAEAGNPAADTGLLADLSTFGSAFTDEALKAGDAVGGVGRGVLKTFSLAEYAIPAAAVVALGIVLYGFYKTRTKA